MNETEEELTLIMDEKYNNPIELIEQQKNL